MIKLFVCTGVNRWGNAMILLLCTEGERMEEYDGLVSVY